MSYQKLLQNFQSIKPDLTTKPQFFRLTNDTDKHLFEQLLFENNNLSVSDTIADQLKELIKCQNPSVTLQENDYHSAIAALLNGVPMEAYGVWVYYSWNNQLVHLLDKTEFIEVRTNRNQHKITKKERDLLGSKTIGVIGLSVGQSVALALAMERGCGEIRLADFDTLELSNYNRIRTGLYHLGLPKVIVAAREIAEIDPFIEVVCFTDGITENNISDFLTQNGHLDLLIEECDGLDVKILSRQKAKALGIPVLMETNDRGMIDIERFDLNPNYPILHGLIGNTQYEHLKGLTTEQKIPFILKLIGVGSLSLRSKVSLIELGQSLTTWPQLASSVIMGGGIVADISRRILLGQLNSSGRFYFDTEAILQNDAPITPAYLPPTLEPLQLTNLREQLLNIPIATAAECPDKDTLQQILIDAGAAPSSGNDQPWRWLFKYNQLYLFHEISRSYSFGDYKHMASYISFGSLVENLVISAHKHAWEVIIDWFPIPQNTVCIANIQFQKNSSSKTEPHIASHLASVIHQRCTNRYITQPKALKPDALHQLKAIAETIPGATVSFIEKPEQLQLIGEVISAVDRIRIMHPHGHYDFFHREMRWSSEQAHLTKTGMDIQTLEIPQQALAALKILSDDKVMDVLRDIDGAKAFQKVSVQNTIHSAAVGLICMPAYTPLDFINGGRAAQRQWLQATASKIAYQPLIAPLYLFPRLLFGNGEGLSNSTIEELVALRSKFMQLFPGMANRGEVFLFRVFEADEVKERSLRLPIEDILFID